MKKVITIVFVALVSIGLLTSCTDNTEATPTLSTAEQIQEILATQESIVDTTWIPAGYNSYSGDDNVAWKWTDAVGGGYDCEYGDACWAMFVITRDGCPNGLYAELAIFDKNDVQIDYTNDLTTYVSPNQKVRLGFDTFNDNAYSASLADISCR
jgi:hypothetical protein